MKITFSDTANRQFEYWQKHDKKIFKKILELIEAVVQNPFQGIGKPEALKHDFRGYWSRRITKEHRLVYKVSENSILIASCQYHY